MPSQRVLRSCLYSDLQPLTSGIGIELVARWLRGEKVPPTQLVPPRIHPSMEELERRFRAS